MTTRRISTLVLLTLLAGCNGFRDRVIYDAPPAPTAAPQPQTPPAQPSPEVMERRFVSPDTQSDAVQNAVEWARKYEKAIEQNNDLREKHSQMALQNAQLTQQLQETKSELERTRKELSEANAFLQEMHAELNKWKADVLGFREEMRQAQTAELEALSRILQVLGAEPVKPAPEQ